MIKRRKFFEFEKNEEWEDSDWTEFNLSTLTEEQKDVTFKEVLVELEKEKYFQRMGLSDKAIELKNKLEAQGEG